MLPLERSIEGSATEPRPFAQPPAVLDSLRHGGRVELLVCHGSHLQEVLQRQATGSVSIFRPSPEIPVGHFLQLVPEVAGAPADEKVAFLPPPRAQGITHRA